MKKVTVKYVKGVFDYYTDKNYNEDVNQMRNYAKLMDDIYLAMSKDPYLVQYVFSGAGIISIVDCEHDAPLGISIHENEDREKETENSIRDMLMDDDQTFDVDRMLESDPVLQMYREALRIMLTTTDEIPESDKHAILAYLLAARALQCDNAADIDLFKMFLRGRELVVGRSDKYVHRRMTDES